MIGRFVLLICTLLVQPLTAQDPAACSTVEQCRSLAQDAITDGRYETAHDLAWLAYQRGPKQDPATLSLIARAQSLSGRSDDALVMLRRLADAGVIVDDVMSSEDFDAVRSHAQWPQLLAAYESRAGSTATPASRPAESSPATPPAASAAAAAPTPASTALAVAKAATAANTRTDLSIPPELPLPAALAYDAVSARFVMAITSSDALTVLSETSTNAASFTSRGWSGYDVTTALAIDRASGDLWVAVQGTSGLALHRLQLISGRRLEVLEVPGEPRPELVSLASTLDGLYALDAAGRRIYRRTPQAKTLEVLTSLAAEIAPTALAYTRNALYIAHSTGVLRFDHASRRLRAVSAADKHSLAGLHSIAVHDGALFGVQRAADRMTAVRIRLNQAGTAATSIATIGPAATAAATMAGSVYYYVANDDGGSGPALRGVTAK